MNKELELINKAKNQRRLAKINKDYPDKVKAHKQLAKMYEEEAAEQAYRR